MIPSSEAFSFADFTKGSILMCCWVDPDSLKGFEGLPTLFEDGPGSVSSMNWVGSKLGSELDSSSTELKMQR